MLTTVNMKNLIAQLFSYLGDYTIFNHPDTCSPRIVSDPKLPVANWAHLNNVGMLFTVQVRCANHGYERDGNTYHEEWERRYHNVLQIVILAGRRVYVASNVPELLSEVDPASFTNTSNHDSCWRSSGLDILDKLYFEAYEHCWKHMPEEHQRTPAATNIVMELGHFLGAQPFQYVEVERERIPDESYFDRLTSIKPLNWSVHLKRSA